MCAGETVIEGLGKSACIEEEIWKSVVCCHGERKKRLKTEKLSKKKENLIKEIFIQCRKKTKGQMKILGREEWKERVAKV